ncbi:MAG TPA: hypothetical protein VJ817_00635 [Gemmatimonadales bacterium]|nr:hypothetical protein [Gemmatimonadales bacterium]
MAPNWVYIRGDEWRIPVHTVWRIPARASPGMEVHHGNGRPKMADVKKYTEKTEVKTETKRDADSPEKSEHKETTVKTERTVQKDREPVIIIEE